MVEGGIVFCSLIRNFAPLYEKRMVKLKRTKIGTVVLVALVLLIASCGESEVQKRKISKERREQLRREDSLALKIGTLPTMDCLPLYVAKETGLYQKLGVDVRLKPYSTQIDCDAALVAGKIEGNVSDLVRTERMKKRGTALQYFTATNAYWQLVSNRKARINALKQLEEKMVAMARFSVTDMLADMAVDSVKLKSETVFRVQINDPNVRLLMLHNNEMDAMLLSEPQATTARLYKNPVLMDSRKNDLWMGVVAFRQKALADKRRADQLKAFTKAYDMACDSIRIHGMQHYKKIIMQYTKADERTVDSLPKLEFKHASSPRQKDIDKANRWLSK